MNEKVQEGLFEGEMNEGKPMQLQAAHRCAKCGTGYAGPECQPLGTELDDLVNLPGGIVRVGPRSQHLADQFQDAHEATILNLLGGIIGEDVSREGLRETPARVVKAWKAWTAGYHQNPADVLKTFKDGAEGSTGQWVIVKDIPIYSHCEHHLAPFFGTATIGYVPNGRVAGLSKLARLADVFAKRLQVQERLTNQIADALMEHLQAQAAMVLVNCRHMCMESRGIQRTGSSTITRAFRYPLGVTQDAANVWRDGFFQQLAAI